MVTGTKLTLDEFLALPETRPYSEYIDGEVVQKAAPSWFHADISAELTHLIKTYLAAHPGEARVLPDLRHATTAAGQRSYLPDISVMRREHIPRRRVERVRGPVWAAPDFAIEVLSPGDYPGRVLDRADFLMRVGTELLWIVDPELETVTVYRPGAAPLVYRAPATLDALPVLSAFTLDLAALFATLHEDEDDEEQLTSLAPLSPSAGDRHP